MNDGAKIAKIKKAKSWYCREVFSHPLHKHHHDNVYGFGMKNDDDLFAQLSLEIHQAGLSWLLVLKKEKALRRAWQNFRINTVAAFGEAEVAMLLADPSIIRNRAKIEAIIGNARTARTLEGGFYGWLKSHHPLPLEDWVKLFRRTFKFCGPELVNEFLVSSGWLGGAHDKNCPIYNKAAASDPPHLWKI